MNALLRTGRRLAIALALLAALAACNNGETQPDPVSGGGKKKSPPTNAACAWDQVSWDQFQWC